MVDGEEAQRGLMKVPQSVSVGTIIYFYCLSTITLDCVRSIPDLEPRTSRLRHPLGCAYRTAEINSNNRFPIC